jgi:DNA-binding transcriptional MerR regulator
MDAVDGTLSIGEVAGRSGVAASTLRYYEDSGLLRPQSRVAGRRRYDQTVLTRLEVIGLCKAAGFSLDEIRVLLADDEPGRPASRSLAAQAHRDRHPAGHAAAGQGDHRMGDALRLHLG